MRVESALITPVATAFGLREAAVLIARTQRKSTLTVTELKYDGRDFGRTAPMPRENAYLVALQLRSCPDHDLWFDGHHVRPKNWLAGLTTIYDLRLEPLAEIREPFHSLMFHLPRHALNSIAEEAGAPRIDELHYQPGVGIDDPVMRQLLGALLPLMARPGEVSSIFTDHLALALVAHIATLYGGMQIVRQLPRGGLARWQVRRATELLSANLDGEVTLHQLAVECRLSVRHFARAFRISTGLSPHRWLTRHRVERAEVLLRDPSLRLIDIALACGFADQSHFTRVFTALRGISPGAWRRMHAIPQAQDDGCPVTPTPSKKTRHVLGNQELVPPTNASKRTLRL